MQRREHSPKNKRVLQNSRPRKAGPRRGSRSRKVQAQRPAGVREMRCGMLELFRNAFHGGMIHDYMTLS